MSTPSILKWLSADATYEDALEALVSDPGRWLWDDYNGLPKALNQFQVAKVQIPFAMAMKMLAEVGKDTPTNKHIYLLTRLVDSEAPHHEQCLATAVGVYDGYGWLYSIKG